MIKISDMIKYKRKDLVLKKFQVTSMMHWVADEFRKSLPSDTYEVKSDFGFDIPSSLPDLWWMPTEHAYQVLRQVYVPLIAPGASWLDSLPTGLLGRDVTTIPVEVVESYQGSRWVKLAEAKSDSFIAGLHSYNDLEKLKLPIGTQLQFSNKVLDLNDETRFYVAHGEVVTGSTYLLNGETWNDTEKTGNYIDALSFAKHVVKELCENQPPAYTLDVAWDNNNNKWIVLEGNPAWSSGYYGSDLVGVAEVIYESMKPSEHWEWKPDPYIVERGKRKRLLVFG